MTEWQSAVEALLVEGVPYVFGLPGDPGHLYVAVYEMDMSRCRRVRQCGTALSLEP